VIGSFTLTRRRQHLVPALLKFVPNPLGLAGVAFGVQRFQRSVHVRRAGVAEIRQQGENARLLGYAAKFLNCLDVKLNCQQVRIREQKMRAQSEVELPVREGKRRQFRSAISPLSDARRDVGEELLHGGHADRTQSIGRLQVVPKEIVAALPRLLRDNCVCPVDSFHHFIRRKPVHGVARIHACTACVHLRIEAGGAAGAIQNP
jgi:hypothetical protein